MKSNLIIRASAGTGKTFSLATRFLRLMFLEKVRPETIVALTFSRAAAQEIYAKLLERLWRASLSQDAAARERDTLMVGLSAGDRASVERAAPDWSPHGFAVMLRRVVDVQHYNTIATLDSFILRIVRSFPLEMGFQNVVDVLDGFGESSAISRSRHDLLARRTGMEDFIRDFKLVTGATCPRSCAAFFSRILRNWRGFMLSTPDSRSWTEQSMRAALDIPEELVRPTAAGLSATGNGAKYFDTFFAKLADYQPGDEFFGKDKASEIALYLAANPEATTYEWDTEKRHWLCDCGVDGAAAIRAAVAYVANSTLAHQLALVAAKLRLCWKLETEYDRSTRKAGLLTFADFTDCQAVREDSDDGLRLQNIQYRFDSRFSHWALDEFQDTSEQQWSCLRRLIREAAGDPSRSVMVVGDLKQSIYTWRGGNDAPFKELMERWPEFSGEMGECLKNDISYRYGRNTADFINRVFGAENLRPDGVLAGACPNAIARWLAEDCWMTHRSAFAGEGQSAGNDYLEVVGVTSRNRSTGDDGESVAFEDEGGTSALRSLAPDICNLARELWIRHEAAHSAETVAILVRDNSEGVYLAECLRSVRVEELPDKTLPVVWEGMNGALDAPVVRAVMQLLKLADHPGDTFAWKAVNALLPLRELVLPELRRAASVSKAMAERLSHLGLSRTLRDIISKLTSSGRKLDARSCLCLEQLVRDAVSYENRGDSMVSAAGFAEYLSVAAAREVTNSPRVIRILTVHRSKGLTFDRVIVPIGECDERTSIVQPRSDTQLVGCGWALESLDSRLARLNPKTAIAWQTAADEMLLSQLRTYYVALTRARKATHVFVLRRERPGKLQFRDLLLAPLGECRLGTMPEFAASTATVPAPPAWQHAHGQPPPKRHSPSADAVYSGKGWTTARSTLFAAEPAAAEHGVRTHEELARIEWIDPENPKNATDAWILASEWRAAFVKTDATSGLWRERAYERFTGDSWESGQFDRVVFSGGGDTRSAVIYDFKTNARRADESEAAFSNRMVRTYSGQLASYRSSLSAITGIPTDRIQTQLLLITGVAVLV